MQEPPLAATAIEPVPRHAGLRARALL